MPQSTSLLRLQRNNEGACLSVGWAIFSSLDTVTRGWITKRVPRSQAPCQSKPLRKSSTSSKMTEMAQERNAFTSGKRMITRRRGKKIGVSRTILAPRVPQRAFATASSGRTKNLHDPPRSRGRNIPTALSKSTTVTSVLHRSASANSPVSCPQSTAPSARGISLQVNTSAPNSPVVDVAAAAPLTLPTVAVPQQLELAAPASAPLFPRQSVQRNSFQVKNGHRWRVTALEGVGSKRKTQK